MKPYEKEYYSWYDINSKCIKGDKRNGLLSKKEKVKRNAQDSEIKKFK